MWPVSGGAMGKKYDSDNLESMEYRGIEYTLVQGIKPGVWEWTEGCIAQIQ